jgi:hypothetical protein
MVIIIFSHKRLGRVIWYTEIVRSYVSRQLPVLWTFVVWEHKTSLIARNCNWDACTYKLSQRACICVVVESLLPLSTILIFDFWFWNCSDNVIFFIYIWSPHRYIRMYWWVVKIWIRLLNTMLRKCIVLVAKMKNYTHN